jgi:hypothetical protein
VSQSLEGTGTVFAVDSSAGSHSLSLDVPEIEGGTLTWAMAFDEVEFDSLSSEQNADNHARLLQLRAALDAGSLPDLAVRFQADFNGDATFLGSPGDTGLLLPLDLASARDVLLEAASTACDQNALDAIGFVSAPSLGLTDVPVRLRGRVSTPHETYPEAALVAAGGDAGEQQQQQIVWQPCNLIGGVCRTQDLTAFCPTWRQLPSWEVEIDGQVYGPFTDLASLQDWLGRLRCNFRVRRTTTWVRAAGNCVMGLGLGLARPFGKYCYCRG